MQRYHRRYTSTAPRANQKNRASADIQYTDVMYIYRNIETVDLLGDTIKTQEGAPLPVECSFQEHALDSERNNYDRINSHYVRIFTRYRNVVVWGDKIVCRSLEMICIKAIERFDNYDGSFHHLEIRAKYDNEK